MKKLVELFDKYKCDKGSLKHRYDRVYEHTLEPMRDKEIRLLEIGIFRGPSLEAWVEYLPNANICGVDIFTRINPKDVKILQHPRVNWAECDSINGPFDNFKSVFGNKKFDIIIDDGRHTPDAQRLTFQNFFSKLKKDGVYFIEDVWPWDIMTPPEKNHRWIKSHPKDFSDKQYQELLETISQYEYKYHDLRNKFDPDTFIIEIRK